MANLVSIVVCNKINLHYFQTEFQWGQAFFLQEGNQKFTSAVSRLMYCLISGRMEAWREQLISCSASLWLSHLMSHGFSLLGAWQDWGWATREPVTAVTVWVKVCWSWAIPSSAFSRAACMVDKHGEVKRSESNVKLFFQSLLIQLRNWTKLFTYTCIWKEHIFIWILFNADQLLTFAYEMLGRVSLSN